MYLFTLEVSPVVGKASVHNVLASDRVAFPLPECLELLFATAELHSIFYAALMSGSMHVYLFNIQPLNGVWGKSGMESHPWA